MARECALAGSTLWHALLVASSLVAVACGGMRGNAEEVCAANSSAGAVRAEGGGVHAEGGVQGHGDLAAAVVAKGRRRSSSSASLLLQRPHFGRKPPLAMQQMGGSVALGRHAGQRFASKARRSQQRRAHEGRAAAERRSRHLRSTVSGLETCFNASTAELERLITTFLQEHESTVGRCQTHLSEAKYQLEQLRQEILTSTTEVHSKEEQLRRLYDELHGKVDEIARLDQWRTEELGKCTEQKVQYKKIIAKLVEEMKEMTIPEGIITEGTVGVGLMDLIRQLLQYPAMDGARSELSSLLEAMRRLRDGLAAASAAGCNPPRAGSGGGLGLLHDASALERTIKDAKAGTKGQKLKRGNAFSLIEQGIPPHLPSDSSASRDVRCTLPSGLAQYGVVSQGDASLCANTYYAALAIGGQLFDCTPGSRGVVDGFSTLSQEPAQPRSWVFSAGYQVAPLSSIFNWTEFEGLAQRAVPGEYPGGYKVVVVTRGGTYDTRSLRPGGHAYDMGMTLAVFNTREDVRLVGSGGVEGATGQPQFGPSILAPFSSVTLEISAGFINGFLVAKRIGRSGGDSDPNSERLEMHGDPYTGPLFCRQGAVNLHEMVHACVPENWRCSGDPIRIGNKTWGGLGAGISAEACKAACLGEAVCAFAVFRPHGGVCSAFAACSEQRFQLGFNNYEKLLSDSVATTCANWTKSPATSLASTLTRTTTPAVSTTVRSSGSAPACSQGALQLDFLESSVSLDLHTTPGTLEFRYRYISEVRGNPVDLVVTSRSGDVRDLLLPVIPGAVSGEPRSPFGLAWVRGGSVVNLTLSFQDSFTGAAVAPDELHFSIFDVDQSEDGEISERWYFSGIDGHVVTDGSEVDVAARPAVEGGSGGGGAVASFRSTVFGSDCDDPQDPQDLGVVAACDGLGEVDQAKRSALIICRGRASFDVSLEVACGAGARAGATGRGGAAGGKGAGTSAAEEEGGGGKVEEVLAGPAAAGIPGAGAGGCNSTWRLFRFAGGSALSRLCAPSSSSSTTGRPPSSTTAATAAGPPLPPTPMSPPSRFVPQPQASSPKPQAPSPKPKAPSPKPQAPSPKPQAQSTKPKDPSPKPQAQIAGPRSQIPDPRSQIPDPRSQIPDPRPKPQAPSPNPQSPREEGGEDKGEEEAVQPVQLFNRTAVQRHSPLSAGPDRPSAISLATTEPVAEEERVLCAFDVSECWDGSFVSRDFRNDCKFPPCPKEAKGKDGGVSGVAGEVSLLHSGFRKAPMSERQWQGSGADAGLVTVVVSFDLPDGADVCCPATEGCLKRAALEAVAAVAGRELSVEDCGVCVAACPLTSGSYVATRGLTATLSMFLEASQSVAKSVQGALTQDSGFLRSFTVALQTCTGMAVMNAALHAPMTAAGATLPPTAAPIFAPPHVPMSTSTEKYPPPVVESGTPGYSPCSANTGSTGAPAPAGSCGGFAPHKVCSRIESSNPQWTSRRHLLCGVDMDPCSEEECRQLCMATALPGCCQYATGDYGSVLGSCRMVTESFATHEASGDETSVALCPETGPYVPPASPAPPSRISPPYSSDNGGSGGGSDSDSSPYPVPTTQTPATYYDESDTTGAPTSYSNEGPASASDSAMRPYSSSGSTEVLTTMQPLACGTFGPGQLCGYLYDSTPEWTARQHLLCGSPLHGNLVNLPGCSAEECGMLCALAVRPGCCQHFGEGSTSSPGTCYLVQGSFSLQNTVNVEAVAALCPADVTNAPTTTHYVDVDTRPPTQYSTTRAPPDTTTPAETYEDGSLYVMGQATDGVCQTLVYAKQCSYFDSQAPEWANRRHLLCGKALSVGAEDLPRCSRADCAALCAAADLGGCCQHFGKDSPLYPESCYLIMGSEVTIDAGAASSSSFAGHCDGADQGPTVITTPEAQYEVTAYEVTTPPPTSRSPPDSGCPDYAAVDVTVGSITKTVHSQGPLAGGSSSTHDCADVNTEYTGTIKITCAYGTLAADASACHTSYDCEEQNRNLQDEFRRVYAGLSRVLEELQRLTASSACEDAVGSGYWYHKGPLQAEVDRLSGLLEETRGSLKIVRERLERASSMEPLLQQHVLAITQECADLPTTAACLYKVKNALGSLAEMYGHEESERSVPIWAGDWVFFNEGDADSDSTIVSAMLSACQAKFGKDVRVAEAPEILAGIEGLPSANTAEVTLESPPDSAAGRPRACWPPGARLREGEEAHLLDCGIGSKAAVCVVLDSDKQPPHYPY